MRSHRLAVVVVSLAGALSAGGCGAGREAPDFAGGAPIADETAVQATPAQPVVVAAPQRGATAERDAAAVAAAVNRAAASSAEAKRKAADAALRQERAKEERARRRAAAREARLREALAAKNQDKAPIVESATPTPKASDDGEITASDVGAADVVSERDRRSDAEARAAVVRFHELLDRHDARSCDLMTRRLLQTIYGAQADAMDRCRAAVAGLTSHVSVVIAESRAHGKRATIAVVSHMDDAQVAQTLRLVLVNGTWLIDEVQRSSAS